MSKLNLIDEMVAKHSTEDIISHLYSDAKNVYQIQVKALKEDKPNLAFSTLCDLAFIKEVLGKLDERNKQKNMV